MFASAMGELAAHGTMLLTLVISIARNQHSLLDSQATNKVSGFIDHVILVLLIRPKVSLKHNLRQMNELWILNFKTVQSYYY